MLKIFRSYSPFSVLALLLATLVLKTYWLAHPAAAILLSHQKFWYYILIGIQSIIGQSALAMTFFAMINLVGQAIYLNRIVLENDLFTQKNYLPALCFILFSSLLPEWNYLSASLIGNWFLLISFNNIFKLQNNPNPFNPIFNIGAALSCACLLSFSFLVYIPLFFIALSLFRPFKIREWFIGVLGVLTPIYFLVTLLFLGNQLLQWEEWLPENIQLTSKIPLDIVKPYVVIAFSLVLLLFGLISLNNYSEHMLTRIKKRWMLLSGAFFISCIPLVFDGLGNVEIALPALLFLSMIAANIWIEKKRNWFKRILFYLFIALLIFAEWIPIH